MSSKVEDLVAATDLTGATFYIVQSSTDKKAAATLLLNSSQLDIDGTLAANSDAKISSQKAVKTYTYSKSETDALVASAAAGVGSRTRLRAATTANITIATALNNGDTLDGVTLATGDLVLVKDQSSAAENGVYVVGVVPVRATEYDTYNEYPGTLAVVEEGTANADTIWICTSNAGGTINVTAIVWTQLSVIPPDDSITNAKLANVATGTFKGRTTAGTGDPEDLTATQVTALLNAVVGDSGSGGTKGLVPAPGAGDAAAGKFLKADGTYAVPSTGMTNEQRRNALLTVCSIAKLDAGYKRQLNTFADGYKASDGVSSGSSSNYSVNTASGYVGPTIGSATQITLSGLTVIGDFDTRLTVFTDGTTSQAAASATAKSGTTGNAYIGLDLGSGADKKIDSAVVYPSNNAGFVGSNVGTLTLNLRGSNSAPTSRSDGTLLGTTGAFADTNSSKTITSTDQTTAYRYVWIEFVASSGTDSWNIAELQVLQVGTPDNMTLVTTTQTADATVSNGRVLMEIDPIDSITLNTDLTAEVTCDGGSHWAAATLSSIGKGQSGRTVVETADTSVGANSGTSFAARIKTANNKSVNVYKTALVVH